MNPNTYNEKIEYERTGKILITADEVLQHLRKLIHPETAFYNNYRFYFFVPGITISAVGLCISNYAEKDLKKYTVSVKLPCSLEDLKMLHTIIEFIEVQCRSAGLHIQMNFDRHYNYPGKAALEEDKILNTWKNLISPFCKLSSSKEPFEFFTNNGRLTFLLSSNAFKAIQFNQFKDVFLPSVRNYIWQDQFQCVDVKPYYITPKKNTEVIKEFVTLIAWDNTNPILISESDYLGIRDINKWFAVRPQKWKQIISPYFIQYDLTRPHFLPIIPESIYEKLKKLLIRHSCSLHLESTIKNGIREFYATL